MMWASGGRRSSLARADKGRFLSHATAARRSQPAATARALLLHEVNAMRRQNRKFELARYEALLMQQGDEDVLSTLEALMLAVADEMRRRAWLP